MNVRGSLTWLLAPTLLTVACIEPWEAGVVGIEKTFRVGVDGVSVVPPEPSLSGLLGEDGMAAILQDAGMSAAEVDRVRSYGVSFLDLADVDGVSPIAGYTDRVEASIVDTMESSLEEHARASIANHDVVTAFDSDWSAWRDWELDLEDPDRSIVEGLRHIPVTYRLEIEAESLADLVGADLGDLTDSEMLERVFLQEVGLRTLLPEEVEPDDGWPDVDVASAALEQMTDPETFDGCAEGQVAIDQTVGAHIRIVSMEDPEHHGVLADVDALESHSDCSVMLESDPSFNLEPFVNGPFRIEVELTLTPGTNAYDLGGYILPGVEGRFKVPGSFVDHL